MSNTLSDAALFGTTLNAGLNGDTKPQGVRPESFPRLAAVKPETVAMHITNVAAESGLPIIKPVTDDTNMVDEAVQIIEETVTNPTREAYKKAMEALDRLTDQAIISNAEAQTLNRAINKATKPNHYGSKRKRTEKLSKPAKFFGNSKDIIYVEDRGVTKPMSLKTAKKKGFI